MKEPKFVPGERVRVVKTYAGFCSVGDVLTVSHVAYGDLRMTGEGFIYKTETGMAPDSYWGECQLEKLPPNTPSTFEDCIFKPEKVKV